MTDDYEKQAEKFLSDTNTRMEVTPLRTVQETIGNRRMERQVSLVTFYRFRHPGQNIVESFEFTGRAYPYVTPGHSEGWNKKVREERACAKRVTAYDILACLQKHEPGTHEDFCGEFGIDPDSRKGLELYLRVQEEYEKVRRLWSDAIEALQEIQ